MTGERYGLEPTSSTSAKPPPGFLWARTSRSRTGPSTSGQKAMRSRISPRRRRLT